MMQINDKTIKSYGFDEEILMNNDSACIEAGGMVLSDIKVQYAEKEKDYWTRYNAGDPEKRAVYKTLVERYL